MSRPSVLIASVAFIALGGGAFGQSPQPQPPKAVPEAPRMGGEPSTKTGPTVINLGSNEVSLARLAGVKVVHVTREQLGKLSPVLFQQSQHETAPVPHNIASVKTELFEPARHAITFLVVNAGKRGSPVLVPWSQVKPFDQPNPVIATSLSQKAVASAPALGRQKRKTIDVEQALIGRQVETGGGKNVGTVSDVIAEIGNGKVDYIVVAQGGIGLGTANAPHAVPWTKIKSVSGDKSQPIMLTLDEQHWKATPVFGASKAQETRGLRNKALKNGASGPIP